MDANADGGNPIETVAVQEAVNLVVTKEVKTLEPQPKETATVENMDTIENGKILKPQPTEIMNSIGDAKILEPQPKEIAAVMDVKNVAQDVENVETAAMEAVTSTESEISNQMVEKVPYELDLSIKHPLHNVWTLWYLVNDRTESWKDMQNEITSFDTVEDFWSVYNHIKPPSEISVGNDYSIFKKGIRPMWEDNANKNGGRWIIPLKKIFKEELDKLWLDIVSISIILL